ncbi:HD domain-containing phosphohydrolase [Sulfurimonas sp.]|uniref:response regulator n=1 Tax=Sulfurimonas sp. TaxID=2022749 RepID=UPI003D0E9F31
MNTSKILIIDSDIENINKIKEIVSDKSYDISYALKIQESIDLLKTKRFDLIILAKDMSSVDSFKLCKSIKNTPLLESIPLIVLVDHEGADNLEKWYGLGCIDHIHCPLRENEVQAKIKHNLEFYKYKKTLKISSWQNKLLLSETELAQNEMVYILSAVIEENNLEAMGHIKRVADFAKQLAVLEGTLTEEDVKTIYLASPMYDIGKVFIDDSIVKKPDNLTDEEFSVMQDHPKFGLKVFENSTSKLLNAAATIAYEHHENYDGTGYPRGLKGDEIHIFARIVAIVSVLDALLEKKSYKESWSFEDAVQYIQEEKGKKFDPRLVTIFEEHLEVFKELVD